ncbi:Ig domain-containing protein [Alicyclobacillus fodiniaquatilis]|uniref:Ig domain-containing protein n=1 Tax=Alicyclobacillus fodiniaquatilis TaxID=1661150 RepID=A0ABW4JL90_9BACL
MEIGGVDPMKWTVTSGSLPAGLTRSDQGVISGTPTGSAGQYTFTVTVTNANNLSSSKQLTLTVNGSSTGSSGGSTTNS